MNARPEANVTAFQDERRLAAGPLGKVAISVKRATEEAADRQPLIFDDATGHVVDVDLRGSDAEIRDRLLCQLPSPSEEVIAASEPRGRGRPKLGVVAREVTLLPRHWEWLTAQPGGASVTLRKLVEEARRTSGDRDRTRQAKDSAYRFMSAMAGNLPGFEDACRALFADDRRAFAERIAGWPADIRDYAAQLAFADRAG